MSTVAITFPDLELERLILSAVRESLRRGLVPVYSCCEGLRRLQSPSHSLIKLRPVVSQSVKRFNGSGGTWISHGASRNGERRL